MNIADEKKGKTFFDLEDAEVDAIVKSAAKSAIARTHEAGRFSTHEDEKGVYRLYPDGHKEYIVFYNAKEGKNDVK